MRDTLALLKEVDCCQQVNNGRGLDSINTGAGVRIPLFLTISLLSCQDAIMLIGVSKKISPARVCHRRAGS